MTRSTPVWLVIAACVWSTGESAAFAQAAAPSKPAAPAQKTTARPDPPAKAEFDRLVKDAAAARDAGRIDQSIALYQKATRLRPSWAEGYWHLGTAFYELDRYAEARDAFARVVRLQPEHAAAFGFKGLCEFKLKSYETALSDLMRADELGVTAPPDLVPAIAYHTAITMTRLEQFEFALAALQSFAQQGNDSPRIIEAFGMALLRIPLTPDELGADRRELVMLAGRGAYYRASRRPAAAKPAFELLVQRYPDAPNVHFAYGLFLLDDEPDRAIAQFQLELKQSPSHVPSMLQIAFEYLKRSDWEAARPWATRIVELEPRDFTGRRALGQVLLETGDATGAIDQFETGVRLAPDSPSMRFMLARAYQKGGRAADAERERAEFLRLERLIRSKKHGEQSVGGVAKPGPPKQ
ncbi:MAG TPA: tetratricopeptide repeat protein [Vicinamibacterales bacterium]|nr:tetratricopeptide repeat protein [Vicinamibacterales bacterium]